MKPRDPKDLPPDLAESGEDGDISLSSENERAAVVASVMRHTAERTMVRATQQPPGPKPLFPQLVGLALSTTLAVYVWFGSPGWLEPDPIPLPPVAEEVATLNVEMFIQASQIEHYRERNGRAPAFLEEVGPARPGVVYERLDAQTYRLRGTGDRVRLSYFSRDPLTSLLTPAGEALLLGTSDR